MKTTVVRILWVSGFALLLMLPLLLLIHWLAPPVRAQEEEKRAPQYLGAKTCARICHKTAKQGKQLTIWQESKHAKAFETLGTPEAKEIALKKGIEDPQKADACLVCHTTAHGAAAELKGPKFSHEEGVGCEVCHGPGSLYKKRKIMKNREKALSNGLLIPDEKTCLKCHNKKSPTYKPFNFEERSKEIAHPKPEAKG